MVSAGVDVSGYEEEKDEEESLSHDDDDQDLPKYDLMTDLLNSDMFNSGYPQCLER